MQTTVHLPRLVKTGFRVLGFLASTLMVSHFIDDRPAVAAALTLQEATQAALSFDGEIYRSDSGTTIQSPISGSGLLTYSSTPIEGTFYFDPVRGGRYVFVTDPSQVSIPIDLFPEKTYVLTATQDYRWVTKLDFTLDGVSFSYEQDALNPGNYFGDLLLFQPPDTTTFPPGTGGISVLSSGDPRRPSSIFANSWFFGDPRGRTAALVLQNNGNFLGYSFPYGSYSSANVGGNWRATAVPEPVSLLGTATALAGGLYLKRRAKASQL